MSVSDGLLGVRESCQANPRVRMVAKTRYVQCRRPRDFPRRSRYTYKSSAPCHSCPRLRMTRAQSNVALPFGNLPSSEK